MKRPTIASRWLLLEPRHATSLEPRVPAPRVRRYRLARLRLGGSAGPSGGRFEYLKHAHD